MRNYSNAVLWIVAGVTVGVGAAGALMSRKTGTPRTIGPSTPTQQVAQGAGNGEHSGSGSGAEHPTSGSSTSLDVLVSDAIPQNMALRQGDLAHCYAALEKGFAERALLVEDVVSGASARFARSDNLAGEILLVAAGRWRQDDAIGPLMRIVRGGPRSPVRERIAAIRALCQSLHDMSDQGGSPYEFWRGTIFVAKSIKGEEVLNGLRLTYREADAAEPDVRVEILLGLSASLDTEQARELVSESLLKGTDPSERVWALLLARRGALGAYARAGEYVKLLASSSGVDAAGKAAWLASIREALATGKAKTDLTTALAEESSPSTRRTVLESIAEEVAQTQLSPPDILLGKVRECSRSDSSSVRGASIGALQAMWVQGNWKDDAVSKDLLRLSGDPDIDGMARRAASTGIVSACVGTPASERLREEILAGFQDGSLTRETRREICRSITSLTTGDIAFNEWKSRIAQAAESAR